MNEKVWKPVFLAGAAALCLFGVYSVLSRPPKSPQEPVSSGAGAAVPTAEWERLIPSEPAGGLSPRPGLVPAGTAPAPAALLRTVSLADGSTLRLELEGVSFGIGTDGARYRLDSVSVWRDGEKLQVLTFGAPYYQHGGSADSLESGRPDFGFSAGDYNFDGRIDFSVSASLLREDGCDADYAYHFLWSPERDYFVPAPELDALPSPAFNETEQTIACAYSSTERFGRELYRSVRGELLGVEKWEQALDREKGVLVQTLFEWAGGGWKAAGSTEEAARREISRTLSLNEGGRRFLLTLTGTVERRGAPSTETGEQGVLTRIALRAEDGSPEGGLVQEIPLGSSNAAADLERNNFNTDLLDLNFDGFPDLRVWSGRGTGGSFYRCFLWEPQEGLFRENAQLNGYGEPWPDPAAREIHTRNSNGYAGYTETYLRWEGEELVPVRRVETVYDGESAAGRRSSREITSVYENGEWREQTDSPGRPEGNDRR